MKLEDLQEFFNVSIINYLPFKDQEIYKTISNYLVDYYFSQSYQDIPVIFKTLFEEHIIPMELYDKLLLSNGFTENIISRLTLNNKLVLLQSFMDFNKYKGTIESFRKVSDLFDDDFNAYELYIDYIEGQWVFVPYLIYKNNNLIDSLKDTRFTYNEIISKTKNFLIDKDTLQKLYVEQNIILPIKTNLIILDHRGYYNHSDLLILYSTIILNHFKDFNIILYLTDGEYKTTIKTFYKLWYYAFIKLYKVSFNGVNGTFINFNFNKEPFPFLLSELFTIKQEYEKIFSLNDRYKFTQKYFQVFDQYTLNDAQSNEDVLLQYEYDIPNELLNYANQRSINEATADLFINELYNSLITWLYSLQSNYDNYKEFLQVFISQLPTIKVSLEDSVFYLLINHFKPYHTEIILNDNYSNLLIRDKFNSVLNDHLYKLKSLLGKINYLGIYDNVFSYLKIINNSNLLALSKFDLFLFKFITNHKVNFSEYYKFFTEFKNNFTISNISDNENFNIKNSNYYDNIISLFDFKFELYLLFKEVSNLYSHKVNYETNFKNNNSLTVINSELKELALTQENSFEFSLLVGFVEALLQAYFQEPVSIKDNVNANFNFKNNNSLTVINSELKELALTQENLSTIPIIHTFTLR